MSAENRIFAGNTGSNSKQPSHPSMLGQTPMQPTRPLSSSTPWATPVFMLPPPSAVQQRSLSSQQRRQTLPKATTLRRQSITGRSSLSPAMPSRNGSAMSVDAPSISAAADQQPPSTDSSWSGQVWNTLSNVVRPAATTFAHLAGSLWHNVTSEVNLIQRQYKRERRRARNMEAIQRQKSQHLPWVHSRSRIIAESTQQRKDGDTVSARKEEPVKTVPLSVKSGTGKRRSNKTMPFLNDESVKRMLFSDNQSGVKTNVVRQGVKPVLDASLKELRTAHDVQENWMPATVVQEEKPAAATSASLLDASFVFNAAPAALPAQSTMTAPPPPPMPTSEQLNMAVKITNHVNEQPAVQARAVPEKQLKETADQVEETAANASFVDELTAKPVQLKKTNLPRSPGGSILPKSMWPAELKANDIGIKDAYANAPTSSRILPTPIHERVSRELKRKFAASFRQEASPIAESPEATMPNNENLLDEMDSAASPLGFTSKTKKAPVMFSSALAQDAMDEEERQYLDPALLSSPSKRARTVFDLPEMPLRSQAATPLKEWLHSRYAHPDTPLQVNTAADATTSFLPMDKDEEGTSSLFNETMPDNLLGDVTLMSDDLNLKR